MNPEVLTECKGCGHEVSREAASCPNCGQPIKPKQSATGVLAAIIIAIVIFFAIGRPLAGIIYELMNGRPSASIPPTDLTEAASRAPGRQQAAPRPAATQSTTGFVTLVKPVEVKVAYGNCKLPTGTRLKVFSRTATAVNAYYMGDTVVVPVDAVAEK